MPRQRPASLSFVTRVALYDTHFFCLFSAVVALNWGGWLLFTGQAFVRHSPSVSLLFRSNFSTWMLILLFFSYGFAQVAALYFDHRSVKHWTSVFGVFLWSFLTFSALFAGYWGPSTLNAAALAVGCTWASLRYKEEDNV